MSFRRGAFWAAAGLVLGALTAASAVDYGSPILGGGPTLVVSGSFAALRRTDTMCAAPGTQVTLDSGLLGEDHLVSDCGGQLGQGRVATVLPPVGETISGSPSYTLSLTGQAASFRRTQFGWAVH